MPRAVAESVAHTSVPLVAVHVISVVVGVMVKVPPFAVVTLITVLPAVAVNVKGFAVLGIVTLSFTGVTDKIAPASTTVADAVALRAWALALMVVLPGATPVITAEPAPVIVATVGSLLDHPTPLVIALRLPSS